MTKEVMGAPLTYDPKTFKTIIKSVHDVLVLGQVAGLICIPRATFTQWIERGDNDRINNVRSDLAHLSSGVRLAQAQEVVILIENIRKNKRGAQNSKWLLEKCFAEDFGRDAEAFKQLLAKYEKVVEHLMKMKDSPLEGFNHG